MPTSTNQQSTCDAERRDNRRPFECLAAVDSKQVQIETNLSDYLEMGATINSVSTTSLSLIVSYNSSKKPKRAYSDLKTHSPDSPNLPYIKEIKHRNVIKM